MREEVVRWLRSVFTRRSPSPLNPDLEEHDRRLDALEDDQHDIEARLHLLETQARRRGGDRGA